MLAGLADDEAGDKTKDTRRAVTAAPPTPEALRRLLTDGSRRGSNAQSPIAKAPQDGPKSLNCVQSTACGSFAFHLCTIGARRLSAVDPGPMAAGGEHDGRLLMPPRPRPTTCNQLWTAALPGRL
jgi:hypothetical protein